MTKKIKHSHSNLNSISWYEMYGFSSANSIYDAYENCGKSTLYLNCKKFNGDKDKLDAWYNNFKPYRSKLSQQTKDMKFIREVTGLDRASIYQNLSAGYTKEEIITAHLNKIAVRYVRTSYNIDGKIYTLASYCREFRLPYRKLNKIRHKLGVKEFKDKLEKGQLTNI